VALAASGCGVGAGNGGGGVCRGVGGGACDCGEVELVVRAESGTYIKEFVHGDAGRTSPSVAAALGRKCDVLWLDVNEIHDA
jgi:tRNA U54 and U55 pseudouridine synthase Pus10